jgi:ubiquinone/menaquinone biosynthesis C-methylase UbiE
MHGRNAALVSRYFPSYRSPKLVYQGVLLDAIAPDTLWLDLGCGERVAAENEVNELLPRRASLAVGCDIDARLCRHSSIKNLVCCDAGGLPFKDSSFTVVTAAMVLEHLKEPERVFCEVARVCRPDARFVVFTPNVFNYGMVVARLTPHWFHALYRQATHYLARGEWRDFSGKVFPTHYRANRVGRLRRQLQEAGFVEQKLERLSFVHTFGFVRPLFIGSLLFERLIDRPWLDVFKADILGVFRRSEKATSG